MKEKFFLWLVIGGSVLLMGLMVWGLSRMQSGENQILVSESVLGESIDENRLVRQKGDEVKVTVVEFSDFECPACGASQILVDEIKEKDGVRLIYRHMPLSSIHPKAQITAEAAEAASMQNKFWEYHNLLYERREEWIEDGEIVERLVGYAEELGLDEVKFRESLVQGEYKEVVKNDYNTGIRLGVNATPSFFVNGVKVSSRDLIQKVEEELAK